MYERTRAFIAASSASSGALASKGAAGNLHPPRLSFFTTGLGCDHHAAGLITAGGSAFDRTGPSTTCPERSEGLRALAHAPISSTLSPNR